MDEVDQLVSVGLERYGKGDVDGALLAWEEALAIDPDETRAAAYVDYVRENYELLAGTPRVAELEGYALGAVPGDGASDAPSGSDDDDEYEVEITGGVPLVDELDLASAPLPPSVSSKAVERYIESVDEGWFLGDEQAATSLAPPPRTAEPPDQPMIEPMIEAIGEALLELDLAPPRASQRHLPLPAENVLELDAEAPDEAPAQASPSGDDSGDFTDQRSVAPTQEIHAPRGFVRSRLTPQSRGGDETGETGTFDPEDDRLRTRPGRSAGSPLELSEIPAGVAQEMLAALTPAAGMQPIGPDERTSESPFVRVTFSPDTQDLALGGGDEEERTVERAAHRADTASEPTVERRSFSPAPLSEPSGRTGRASPHPPLVIVEEQGSFGEPGEPAPPTAQRRHRRSSTKPPPDETDEKPIHRAETVPAGVPHEELKQTLESELDSAAPAGEARPDRTRRRVSDLIDRAVAASTCGDHPIAIVALDLALAEDPESAVAQKLIHRHQPAILDCYQRYLGDLSARPGLAMPMHELSGEKLDIRAAFLLSRIDGALTFEEILDVSGMQRAEAFRHLSNLVLRGILTIA